MTASLDRAHTAFHGQAWSEAYALLASVEELGPDDLECLAVAAHLVGRDDECARAWERAHAEHARRGDIDKSARCAGWLAIHHMLRGDTAQATGWCARASRLLDEHGVDCAARGLLQVPQVLEELYSGRASSASRMASDIVAGARRFHDIDVLAIGLLASGQAGLALGDIVGGMRLLDEAMVSVASGEVSPIPTGIVYCAVIEACMDVYDMHRAAEWTAALSDWCAPQIDLVPYRGQCLVHRSQVMQAHGEWTQATAEADRATARLSEPAHPALGLAFYQQGELHRLRGETVDAERSYRTASEHGREPAPGLALLRLEEGNVDAAVAAIRRTVDETRGELNHATMLAASVEIMLAAGDVEAARSDATELGQLAELYDAPLMRAVADFAIGSVLLADHDAASALSSLRHAYVVWRDLGMPHDAARARLQTALACRALGDLDAADLEIDAARTTFDRLGARPDLARLDRLFARKESRSSAALTSREREVLRLVATGMTNREISAELVISQHTVGRHLQNIYYKLGLSTRAAATAYAYEHDLA